MTSFFNWRESSTTLYFEEVRQAAVPVCRQTTTVFASFVDTGDRRGGRSLPSTIDRDVFRTETGLKREAQMHTLCHENIVKLLAVVFEPGNYGIVLEFVRFGGLDEFIDKHAEKVRNT